MPSSCKEIRQELVDCMLKSDCVLKGHTIKECFQPEHTDDVPAACQSIRRSFFECRRGMLDPRTRFRGNKTQDGSVREAQRERERERQAAD
ncbi:cytochrome c oxidase assembly protein PET191-domain-containing protein [Jimgerdemannia flammicorona]|uniref:Cytochrome c oxidase assembly protein PET191-domain-containing protein n=1 Tax=Jimgerdemannia flammicorona TaxID=994334 RepID=A0A433PIE8_9FUNG|nr:cytochrome c oxidase assembly protein PET191-domain-containing protein [Jimgerdemannia flammicorona]